MSDEENTLKILIATDNHLGVWENDEIRADDSFNTFEEIFAIASRENVDMVLLGGDLFHDNKPSRTTIVKAMDILSRYCLNDRPIALQILSDQTINFTTGRVNYQNPNYNIGLPVFTIHGNHDDPAGTTNLSAVDILATGNLVNYFGKINIVGEDGHNAGKLRIHPILLQKGETRLALYGLGNIRDERLCRLFSTPNCVEWTMPRRSTTTTTATNTAHAKQQNKASGSRGGKSTGKRKAIDDEDDDEDDDTHTNNTTTTAEEDDWFNIFILHQNRVPHAAAAKNVLREGHLPPFLNIVVWGHEHECIEDPWDTTAAGRSFSIMQPGSSVATALSEGESKKKHVVMLEIKHNYWRTSKFALQTVRPFLFDSVTLQGQDGLDPENPETVKNFLQNKVESMIDKAVRSRTANAPALPLVRLRVDYTGFSTINTQQFGQRFVGKAANPQDIILWQKKAAPRRPRQGTAVPTAEMQTMEEIRIEDLIAKYLQHNLEVLPETELTQALHDYVEKEDTKAIGNMIDTVLKETEKTAMEVGDGGGGDKDWNETIALASKKRLEKKEADALKKAKENVGDGSAVAPTRKGRGGRSARTTTLATELLADGGEDGSVNDDFGFDDDFDEGGDVAHATGSTRRGAATKRGGGATKQTRLTSGKATTTKTTGRARPTSLKRKDASAAAAALPTIDEDELPSSGMAASISRNPRRAATAARTKMVVEEDEDEDDDGDKSEDDMELDDSMDDDDDSDGGGGKKGRGKSTSVRGRGGRAATARGGGKKKTTTIDEDDEEDGNDNVGTAEVPISLLDSDEDDEDDHARGGRAQRGSQHPQRSQFSLGRNSTQASRGWGGFK